MSSLPESPEKAIERAFGFENRRRLLQTYFEEITAAPVSPATAWLHVYRLLLWIDRTIGLAHCYESDKCQPGRPWYARSLRFHEWVSGELDSTPANLVEDIDWLFRSANLDLSATAAQRAAQQRERASSQRAPYEGTGMPSPGEDRELEAIINGTLAASLDAVPPAGLAATLATQVQTYVSTENKRKNLVGEGFEDTLAQVLRRSDGIGGVYAVHVRPSLHELPGFNPPRGGDKTRKVDLAMVRHDGWRVLVSCKWSVRSDREEQFATDFETYARLEADGEDFGYVLVTNEFDPARLAAACEARRPNGALFTSVVHVNPEGPRQVLAPEGSATRTSGGAARALGHIDSGRLTSLEAWLSLLARPS